MTAIRASWDNVDRPLERGRYPDGGDAFTNPGTVPARMLFLVTPSGHEQYLEGVAELLSRPGHPDQSAIVELRARYDIEQLTPMIPDRRRTAG